MALTRFVVLLATGLVGGFIYFVFGDTILSADEKRIQRAIINSISSEQNQIDIASIADPTWEVACMVAPYTSEFNFTKVLGHDILNYEAIRGWIDDERYWSLVFVRKSYEIVPVRIQRSEVGSYSFPRATMMQCLPINRAILEYDSKNLTRGLSRTFKLVEKP